MDIDQHISAAARRAQQAEDERVRDAVARAERARTAQRECESEIRRYARIIGERQHGIFTGRTIRWLRADFNSCPREWQTRTWHSSGCSQAGGGVSGEDFIFRNRETSRHERVKGGLFFPEWDLSIPDALWDDIHDKEYLEASAACVSVVMLRSDANKKAASRILERYSR